MGRRDYEPWDAMADAGTAARTTGGQFRQLVPVYSDRAGFAYQVMRGQRVRRRGLRAVAVTAVVAAVGGALTALAAVSPNGKTVAASGSAVVGPNGKTAAASGSAAVGPTACR
ncbi:hypothetical protein [Paractinoplanes durhamensis]|uniref:Uncharacterized protein n=1 Tax=Paractinoplanes durhamensis TaxID=113563 RepID=A0ABQ3Z502_9ACTN|nr:hypothetical protein [Actinoplanes durhamensis]GIE04913.1 hypothetical protein Adu01nite_62630 [Actinoplanes durhamensis]